MTFSAAKYELGQRVYIPDAEIEGIITEIRLTFAGLAYHLEYWRDREPKQVICREEEIQPVKKQNEPGIKP